MPNGRLDLRLLLAAVAGDGLFREFVSSID